eukprot:COSAG02_NODE_3449_length_6721_cov_180.155995_6_plen_1271_part_00
MERCCFRRGNSCDSATGHAVQDGGTAAVACGGPGRGARPLSVRYRSCSCPRAEAVWPRSARCPLSAARCPCAAAAVAAVAAGRAAMSVAEIGTRAAETAGNSMLAAQLSGAPWANEVMSADTLRRQIVNQVMHSEEAAFNARKAEEAALHRQQVAAAKAHNVITQNLLGSIGAAQTAVGANKFLGKMKTALEHTRAQADGRSPPRSPAPMEGKIELQDILAMRAQEQEAAQESESATRSKQWRKAKKVKDVARLKGVYASQSEGSLVAKKHRRRRRPKIQRIFDQVDEDGSGHLDRAEVGKLLVRLGVRENTEEYVLSLMDLDPDNDGTVTYAEFKRYWDGDTRKERLSQSSVEAERAAAATKPVDLELTVACTGLEPHKLPGVAAIMNGRKGKGHLYEAEEVYAVLSVLRNSEWCYYGKTEKVRCGDSPEFTKVFDFPYYPQFAEVGSSASYNVGQKMDDWIMCGQHCRVELFAKRFSKTRGGGQQQLGSMEFTLHELVETPGRCKGQRLSSGKGVVAIRAVVPAEAYQPPEPPPPSSLRVSSPGLSIADDDGTANVADLSEPEQPDHAPSTLLILCAASKLTNVPEPKVNEDKQSGYFVHFRRRIGVGEGALFENELVARTEVSWQAVGQQNPRWMAFEISTSRLCYNNRETMVRVDLYKVARDGFHLHLSSLDTTVAALCEPAPEHMRSQDDGNMPPAPRESDLEEPWMQARSLLSVDGADTPVGKLHVAVRDSKDGEFPKGETLTIHDRTDESFLTEMLSQNDVKTSDLKDDVKNAQRLLNERKKFASEFYRRRQTHQQKHGKVVAENHDTMIRTVLPNKVVELVTMTQSMRDEEQFGHLQGSWSHAQRRNHHDLSWTRNYNVRPVKHQWNSRAVSTNLTMGQSYEQSQLITLQTIDDRAREMEMDALGITGRRTARRSLSASKAQARRRRQQRQRNSVSRPSTAPASHDSSIQGGVRQSWRIPGSSQPDGDAENDDPQSQAEDAHHRALKMSHTQAVTVKLTKSEKDERQADNVFRVIRQQMKSGNRKLYGQNLSNAKQVFELMDRDKGGNLSAGEFGIALDRLGLGLSEKQKDEVLAVVDADGSGTVDYSEFMYILSGGESAEQAGDGAANRAANGAVHDAAAWEGGLHHGRHGKVAQHVNAEDMDLSVDDAHLNDVNQLEHNLMAEFRDLGVEDDISPVIRGDLSDTGEEFTGHMTTADLDVDSAGGDMYYTMHATKYNVAHGGIERKKAHDEGWFKGAMATLYGDARTEAEGPNTTLHRKSG